MGMPCPSSSRPRAAQRPSRRPASTATDNSMRCATPRSPRRRPDARIVALVLLILACSPAASARLGSYYVGSRAAIHLGVPEDGLSARVSGDEKKGQTAYGILLDAGSGSTKPTVWSWDPCYSEIPSIQFVEKLDKLPPLASFAPSQGGVPEEAGEMLAPALEVIKGIVPKKMWPHTPVFLTATAGVRLLPENERARILRIVNVWLANPDNHPFLYGTRPPFDNGQFWAQAISGDEEGAFGFLDVNFLLGKLVGLHPKSDPDAKVDDDPILLLNDKSPGAVGWVDTGGASLQVSFPPQQSSILGNVYPIAPLQFIHITNSTGSRYASHVLYAHSWNGLGQREARKRMQRGISSRASALGDLLVDRDRYSDPCLLVGQTQVIDVTRPDGTTRNVTFVGSSDYYMCVWFMDVLVLNLNEECLMAPCGPTGTYVPEPGSMLFIGFRKMLDLARPLGLAKEKGSWAPTYTEIATTVKKVCDMTAEEVKETGIEDEWETDSGPCFQGVLMLRFLQGIGSPRIVFADRVGKHREDKFNYARGAILTYVTDHDRSLHQPAMWPKCNATVV